MKITPIINKKRIKRKVSYWKQILFCICFLSAAITVNAQENNLGIGTYKPDPSAVLDMVSKSGSKGMLIPRVSIADALNAGPVTAPAKSLMVYNTNPAILNGNGEGFYFWDTSSGTARWMKLTTAQESGTNNWSTAGNKNTVSGTNFIGTADDKPLQFRIDNTNAGQLAKTTTAFGYSALNPAGTGGYNTALGSEALKANTTGDRNTAVGFWAIRGNTTGTMNTVLGSRGLYKNSTGSFNTGVGFEALFNNTSGKGNVAIGLNTLHKNASGVYNTVVGANTGTAMVDGKNNIVIGGQSLGPSSTGGLDVSSTSASYEMNIGNTLFGTAIDSIIGIGKIGINTRTPSAVLDVEGDARIRTLPDGTAADNFITADESGNLHKTAKSAVLLELNSNSWSTTGNKNTVPGTNFIGTADDKPLQFRINNTNAGQLTKDVTAFGYSALNPVGTGGFNTALGSEVLKVNTTGAKNTAIGFWAMRANTTGIGNTLVGGRGLIKNTTGNENTGVGNNVLQNNTSGMYNVGIGSLALGGNDSGIFNTVVGTNAGSKIKGGKNNIVIGGRSGLAPSSNIDVSAPTANYEMNIGNTLFGVAIDSIVGVGKIGINTRTPSAVLDVEGDARIRNLPDGTAADNFITADANGNLRQIAKSAVLPSRKAYTTPSIVPDDSYSFTLTANSDSFLYISSGSQCGREGKVVLLLSASNAISFLGGGTDNGSYTATNTGSNGDILSFAGLSYGCADGGGSNQFNFVVQKTDNTIKITNKGNIARIYTVRQIEM